MGSESKPLSIETQLLVIGEQARRLQERIKALEESLLIVADALEAIQGDPSRAAEITKTLRATVLELGPKNP